MQKVTDGARAVWAAGDFDKIAELIWEVGGRIVERVGVRPGDAVLDVACGTGNAAIPAALAGGRVVGLDITPELFVTGRRRAAHAGVDVEWVEGDAEALPFPDDSFDVVLSTFGCMFAPGQETAAREVARVLKPGGRIGIASWTPDGAIGDFFRTIGKHVPPPPEPVQSPTLWGDEDHVRRLFAESDLSLELEREVVIMRFDSAEQAVGIYEGKFGPVVRAREALEPEGRWQALRSDLLELFETHNVSADGGTEYPGEYLVLAGRRVSR